MARDNRRGGTWRGWVAVLVFLVGIGLLLLAVFGPVVWGDKFDGGALKTPAWGLIVAGIYVALGVSIPDLLGNRAGKEKGDGDDG